MRHSPCSAVYHNQLVNNWHRFIISSTGPKLDVWAESVCRYRTVGRAITVKGRGQLHSFWGGKDAVKPLYAFPYSERKLFDCACGWLGKTLCLHRCYITKMLRRRSFIRMLWSLFSWKWIITAHPEYKLNWDLNAYFILRSLWIFSVMVFSLLHFFPVNPWIIITVEAKRKKMEYIFISILRVILIFLFLGGFVWDKDKRAEYGLHTGLLLDVLELKMSTQWSDCRSPSKCTHPLFVHQTWMQHVRSLQMMPHWTDRFTSVEARNRIMLTALKNLELYNGKRWNSSGKVKVLTH